MPKPGTSQDGEQVEPEKSKKKAATPLRPAKAVSVTPCPICGLDFSDNVLAVHAATCGDEEFDDVGTDDSSSPEVSTRQPVKKPKKFSCPKCDKSFVLLKRFNNHSC